MKKGLKFRRVLALALTVGMISTAATLVPAAESMAAVDWSKAPIPTLKESVIKKAYTMMGKTMHLLKTGQRVRIAITGQSVSDSYGNTWCQSLIDFLKSEYPDATIEYKNFAIGGFATSCLKKRMFNDMASFGPDLVILYDYGSNDEYEYMVKTVRENFESEMLLQTEHYTGESTWSDNMSSMYLPQIATKYKCGLAQIRNAWKSYITTYFDGDASVLLQDDVHLNTYGQTFMLELMKQFFVQPASSDAEELIAGQTKTVSAADWNNGVLEVSGVGTRAEVVAGDGTQYACNVLVDGKKPSEWPQCYIRSAETGGMYGTIMGEIDYNSVPGEQKWTIKIESFSDEKNFKYSVSGEKSGSQGTSDNAGVLNASILNMTPNSFIFDFSKPSSGTTYTFNSILNGTDKYDGSTGYSENKQLLFNFKNDGKGNNHTVKLTAVDSSKIPDIKAIRFYDPALVVTATAGGTSPSASATAKPTGTASATPTATATGTTPTATPSTSTTATPSTSATATGSASATASAAPSESVSASPSDDPSGEDKVTIKFAKKSVKIKKGKKATLKIKLVGAKKAKFSVNKKKVAKIVKAKAKKVIVKGLKKGKAVVTAKAAGKKAKCTVKVA